MLSRDLAPISIDCPSGTGIGKPLRIAVDERIGARGCRAFDAIRRPRNTPIWKLEPALKCRSCRTPRYSPPVHMIKLTQQREITPYARVHPDDDERRQ